MVPSIHTQLLLQAQALLQAQILKQALLQVLQQTSQQTLQILQKPQQATVTTTFEAISSVAYTTTDAQLAIFESITGLLSSLLLGQASILLASFVTGAPTQTSQASEGSATVMTSLRASSAAVSLPVLTSTCFVLHE